MLEGSYSIASDGSDGSVHVWRVDTVAPTSTSVSTQPDLKPKYDRSRVVGTSCLRTVDPREGEVLAVSHYRYSSASIVTFATQRGVVHSWDLRCADERFALSHGPDLGYLSSIALGSDRNWIVTGTSRGYLALWGIRFQQAVKLWRQSHGGPIHRLATSFVPPPQNWGSVTSNAARPSPSSGLE